MALPSSPPLLPELDLPNFPPPLSEDADDLPIRPTASTSTLSQRPTFNRKRQYSDYGSLSSDPVFSEGPSDAEEEEGADRRRRKKYLRGPWFNLRRASSTQSLMRNVVARKEREGKRNVDSGVFMGSDWSDDSVDSATYVSRRKLARMDVGGGDGDDDDEVVPPPSSPPPLHQATPQRPPTPEQLAEKRINQCLETNHESIDLSDLNLTHLSDSTLRPLHQLIKHPAHSDLSQPPSEDEFSPFIPSIQLFLSGNRLTSLPTELFRLTNITVLSLRNNNLTSIPPGIGKLPFLKELNVAQNDIRWLPWEMLDLMHCRGTHRQITIRPNPLVHAIPDLQGPSPLPRPSCTTSEFKDHLGRWGETSGAFFQQMKRWYSEDGVPWTLRHELELRLKLGRLRFNRYLTETSRAGVELQQCNEQLIYVASSAVQFFDVDGSPHRSSPTTFTDSGISPTFQAVIDPLPTNATPTTSSSSVPSLYELSLRTLQHTFTAHDLAPIHSSLPPKISTQLHRAFHAAEHGGATGSGGGNESCSVCCRKFIVARAQWMEFWFHGFPSQDSLTVETLVPFLRRVCGWGCAVRGGSGVGEFRF